MQRNPTRENLSETVGAGVAATIAGRSFVLSPREVISAMAGAEPEPVASHFVVVDGRRFPPKQVVGEVTGLDRADFTTHQARRTLMRLGFAAGRRSRPEPPHARATQSGDSASRLSDRLRPLAGQWVAIQDEDVVHASDSPQALLGWLSRHGQKADSMFRVPEDELAAAGLAPL